MAAESSWMDHQAHIGIILKFRQLLLTNIEIFGECWNVISSVWIIDKTFLFQKAWSICKIWDNIVRSISASQNYWNHQSLIHTKFQTAVVIILQRPVQLCTISEYLIDEFQSPIEEMVCASLAFNFKLRTVCHGLICLINVNPSYKFTSEWECFKSRNNKYKNDNANIFMLF